MKRVISICLIFMMSLGLIPRNSAAAPGTAGLQGTSTAAAALTPASAAATAPVTPAAPVKDGYTLVPLIYGASGVDVSSAFLLTPPDDIPLEKIARALSIDGQPAPSVTQSGANGFLVSPAATLASNTLYIFRLERDGKDDITWAFQTCKKFQITSNYPYDQATNVPVNSGVEITFSDEGYTSFEECFSITPEVGGRFEYHKNTAVFVPRKLDYRTLYTVTVKAGVRLSGTNEALLTDYVFSFETEAEPGHSRPERPSYVYFFNNYAELPSIEAPKIGYGVSYPGGNSRPVPQVNVYKFRSADQAAGAVREICFKPYWARYSGEDSLIDTGALNRVMTFSAVGNDGNRYYDTLELPDKLSQGFYLIDAAIGGSHSQMIVQISDLPVQVVADSGKSIVWVNDVATGGASARSTVYDVTGGASYTTDSAGVAVIDRALSTDGSEQLNITSADGKTCVWIHIPEYYYYGYWYTGTDADESYWSVLQLDRTLFRRDDEVSFFGFVQNRDNYEEISNVTAVLTQAYGFGRYGERDILLRQVAGVQNGAYSGVMKLPNLDSGSYSLTVYHGDIVLGSTYFTVADYVKPPYQLDVTADKCAVFAGDTVTFTAKAGFFEGTPVADLDVSYRLYAYNLITSGWGTVRTDTNGLAAVTETVAPGDGAQGETSMQFTAEATLPEIGRTVRSAYVRAFINDISVRASASRDGRNAALTVDVNSITLDRLNDGTAVDYYDYLGAPTAGKSISVEVYRAYYTRVESGEYYDYIEKRSVPIYRYVYNEETINSFSIVTGSDGNAKRNFTVPDREFESYFARLSCVDGNGRRLTRQVYIGRDYSGYYRSANSNDYFLEGVKDGYAVGEEVTLTLMRGTNKVVRGNFLFVALQRGIQGYQAGGNPYSFAFSKDCVPNTTVKAYYFNGYNYQSNYNMRANISYDYSKSDLTLTAAPDKASYKPGDICSITVTASDGDGNAKEALVNISIVDEALFALRDYTVNTLDSLYRYLSSGLRLSSATHETYSVYFSDENAPLAEGGAAESEPMAPLPDLPMTDGEAAGDDTYLREIFKDTAFFATLRTNARGEAVYTFRLPDNITSWRLTVSGISSDLYAGNSVQNIIVTNPMFISYTLNNSFLSGDTPSVGVNVYGSSLTGSETVDFEVWDENTPDVKYTASGASFERVDIPLWEMKNEGANALVIKASVSNGTSDAVRHQYQVLSTYREIDSALYYDVTAGTVFYTGNSGLTNITFTDRSRGQYLYHLLSMRYVYGDRVEKLAARREADRLLSEYFPDLTLYGTGAGVDFTRYQRADGGIAILPYAESDVITTVKLMPFIIDDVDINALKNYLYGVFEGENADNKMCALYGLAMLREPVLLHLNNYSALGGLPVKDVAYTALGYLALGEKEAAAGLYDGYIAPRLQQIAPYYRVNTGVDNDDILEATSAACMLATMLDRPEKEGLYKYCIDNYTTDTLITLERLSYIRHEIAKKPDVSGSITYTLFGQSFTRDLSGGSSYTLRIPAQNIGDFKLLEVTGDVSAVSVYKKPLTDAGGADEDITVRRRYYKEGGDGNSSDVFEQGDLVRVQIWIDYTAKAINGSYSVTDYLPSGLAYVNNSAKIRGAGGFGYGWYRYCVAEGQKVTFYDYNGRFDKGCLYYYYARVVSPGTFMAEGPLVQNLIAADCFTVGDDSIVVIR